MAPPKENPAKRSGASPGSISRKRRCTRSRYSLPVVSRGTEADAPYDGWSRACTVKRSASGSMFRVQCRQHPIPPWKSTTSGPLPLVRAAMGRASLRAVRSLTWRSESAARLADGGQDLPARLDGLGVDEDDGEQAR